LHHKREGLLYNLTVVTSVAFQYLLPCGNQRMCTKVQPTLILLVSWKEDF